jgi:hypothetical protein
VTSPRAAGKPEAREFVEWLREEIRRDARHAPRAAKVS